MRQFINASDHVLASLEHQASGVVRIFHDQEMPAGATPARARVGFEVRQSDGSAVLYVDRGVTYTGANQDVRAWFEAGEKRFASFGDLHRWVRQELASSYAAHVPEPPAEARRPEDLTNIDEAAASLAKRDTPAYLNRDEMFEELSKHVRGQDDALRALCLQVCNHIARPKPRRPTSLFAVGPTGVGKTKTAESLPHVLRALVPDGADYSYLRLDMSEYREEYRVSQLLGSPQGYVGYGEGAQLVDALAANPKTIVLFDEISRAHPTIWQTLMNAMDAGRLSTASAKGHGREIDCRHAIFIFTSNLEARGILEELVERNGFDNASRADDVCRRHLRAAGVAPELLGRVRRFLVFQPLGARIRMEIITLAIAHVAEEYGLRVDRIAPSVVASIMEQARSNEFGARPDEYLVDELLGEVFADAASAHTGAPVEVCGPPFECAPIAPADVGSDTIIEENSGSTSNRTVGDSRCPRTHPACSTAPSTKH
jgi:hypothetical protein